MKRKYQIRQTFEGAAFPSKSKGLNLHCKSNNDGEIPFHIEGAALLHTLESYSWINFNN